MRRLIPLVVAVLGLVAAPLQAVAAPPQPVPSDARIARQAPDLGPSPCALPVTGAAVNPRLTSLFTAQGNDNTRTDDWTGADGTFSVKLPGGREVWVFSDTFLGTVNPDGSRPPVVEEGGTTVLLNNSFAVERHGRLETIYAGTADDPRAIMPPRDENHWYWAGDATVAGGLLEVTYQEYERFGPGTWDWRWHRNVVARFAPGRLDRPISVHDLPSGRGVSWASGVHRDGPHTYVYGVEDFGIVKYMHVARVWGPSLTGPWQFLTASGEWSWNQADSGRIMEGVANEYSVSRVRGSYVLITHDTTELLGPHVVAYFSCSPYGPWGGKTPVYTTPETGGNVFTYNAHAHPEISPEGTLVVSYNVNTFVSTDHYRDVTIYRPRFLDVSFLA
ncbi:DUF4185 domain-containing protein [Nonomuraea soli]|uniref:DUF4185 domain-containing protein n=1 Tax=Nonomuraea soli TaxID=1032476 RepID=A0A7W0HQT3_9ACTN|nr:DUF4185 domain-containing protein [Nonomuraea soli]MBA2892147.1 hypothetical protein [Nonomuraea soli]